jgi:hypothetical protein
MTDLVEHPFLEDVDSRLRAIDPAIPVARKTTEEVLERILKGYVTPEKAKENESPN